jgi:hypothetical protein
VNAGERSGNPETEADPEVDGPMEISGRPGLGRKFLQSLDRLQESLTSSFRAFGRSIDQPVVNLLDVVRGNRVDLNAKHPVFP